MTQLLVSVRNVHEAIAAVEGGADIIDVKEPHRGSLGCAAPDVILAIADAVSQIKVARPPLSLALGELKEWQRGDLASLRYAIHKAAPQFLKLGLAEADTLLRKADTVPGTVSRKADTVPGSVTWGSGTVSWVAEWQQVRATIAGAHEWVAVAYADDEQARSPAIDLVLQAAIEGGCRVLLIDTHTKNGRSLLDQMSLNSLQAIRGRTQEHRLKLALAGSVGTSDLPRLLRIQPDIIAVRGAVCAHGDRTAAVCRNLVHEFATAIREAQRSAESV